MTVIVVANPKGGVGKSTLATHVAGYHARRGQGGCGLTILGAASVHPSSQLFPLGLFHPDIVDDYRRLIPQLPARLAPGGIAVLELGAGQAPAVAAIARQAGMGSWTRKDLGGHERALVLFTCIDGAIG